MVFCAIFSVKSVIRPIQARVVAFLKQNIPLFQIDGQITRDNFEEVFMAACNIKPLSLNQNGMAAEILVIRILVT